MCTCPDAIVSAACPIAGRVLDADSGWPRQKPWIVIGLTDRRFDFLRRTRRVSLARASRFPSPILVLRTRYVSRLIVWHIPKLFRAGAAKTRNSRASMRRALPTRGKMARTLKTQLSRYRYGVQNGGWFHLTG
jgi:hypothetical protein